MFATLILPSLVLIVSAIEDVRHKKVQNKILLVLLGLILTTHLLNSAETQWSEVVLGFTTAFLILLPLYILKAMGAADLKVFMLVGLATGPTQVLNIFLFSLLAAFIFGFIIILLNKNLSIFIQNLKNIISLQKLDSTQLQTIPFAVALLAGWACHLVYQYHGRIL